MNLAIIYNNVRFKNPLVLASGILGVTGNSLKHVVENGAGGVTIKSIWLKEHIGHPNPTMIGNEHFFLNAVGLPDAGIEKAKEEIATYLKWAIQEDGSVKAPLIASVVAGKVDDFGETAEQVAELKPHLIEVNISCPNVEDELGKPFACDFNQAARVTREVKKRVSKIPIIIKLSPNVSNIVEIAKSIEDAGADGLTCFNTFGPGMCIDIETAQPILANRVGGLSGPGLKPLVVKMIFDLYKAVKIPIIGTGGVLTGRDVIELMMSGATLVGMGTAVYYRGVEVFGKVAEEIRQWCEKNGVEDISEVVGRAHQ
ncbi:MAG: dihydroorotate dehydrogenase family protein, dihydroorotate dehydrogenase (fumarate) [Candidatus Peregrinibacteria bacterium GW2011_GWE2_39_6]|nr:MAG: dihydroorotate dehydrogenase family protein, dihydroorotate dehydrogenase (fumarate) [Candidatus Peregrinibacteria bacterium GW2011_GWF2_39_17]KKR24581.1 MAG: dihydroorotate dehydrogenase family protein, dihydroorotate dehydrogenase (fumarate) [Candidatus Peregrinibacteria bacterium GW2011_GWE2_39_6]HCW32686.1 dihydroorotate dehydrogenase [Candidatus Peregrinibacteria bacterium]